MGIRGTFKIVHNPFWFSKNQTNGVSGGNHLVLVQNNIHDLDKVEYWHRATMYVYIQTYVEREQSRNSQAGQLAKAEM